MNEPATQQQTEQADAVGAQVSAGAAPAGKRKKRKKVKIPGPLRTPVAVGIRSAMSAIAMGDYRGMLHAAGQLGPRIADLDLFFSGHSRYDLAVESVGRCFPHMSNDECVALVRESYRHWTRFVVDVANLPTALTPDGWMEHVRFGEISKAVGPLTGDGPAIFIAGHCGNWEVLGFVLSLLGFPMHALYRPLDFKPLDDWARWTRGRHGLELVDKFGATESLPRLMERGEKVAFIADQNAGDRGLFVPMFNRLASAYKTIGLLAIKYDAPVVCGQAVRVSPGGSRRDQEILACCNDTFGTGAELLNGSNGGVGAVGGWGGYVVRVVDVIEPGDWKDQPDPLFYVTARYRKAIEEMIRFAPEQHMWRHRAWKSRPRHEVLGRPFPDRLREKIASLPWMSDDDVARVIENSRVDAEAYARNPKKRR